MDKFYESKVRHKRSCLYIIPLIGNVQNRHIYRDRMQVTGCQKLGEGRNGVTPKGYGVSFGSDKNVWEWDGMAAQYCDYTKKKKNHWTVHFKITTVVNFTVFKFYLNLKEKVEGRACCRLEWELMSNKSLWTLVTSVFTVEDYPSMVKYIGWLLQRRLISSNEIQVT